MQGNSKPVCRFFQKGNCTRSNCNFLHVNEPSQGGSQILQMDYDQNLNTNPQMNNSMQNNPNPNPTSNPQNKSSLICGFFLKGKCGKEGCRFFHGYSENLLNVQFEKIMEKQIVSLCLINDKKFISADDNTVQIWIVSEEGHKSIGTQNFMDEKITRVIFSNEKVIVATLIEQMLSSKAKIYIITDKGTISQEATLKKINDIVEVDSYIFAVGDGNQIDVFYIDMIQGVLNRLNPILNENDKSEMMCVAFSQSRTFFFVGHKSGAISAYMPDPNSMLKLLGLSKFHDGAINKIFLKDTLVGNAMQQFVMTCSSDGYLKIFKSDESFDNIGSKHFDSGVLDIFQTSDYENTEYFVLSLENGELVCLNLGLEEVFRINSRLSSRHRFVLNITNPFKDQSEGNFLIVSDGNSINVNMWIKKGEISNYVQSDSRGGRGTTRGGKGGYQGRGRGGYHGRGGYSDDRGGSYRDDRGGHTGGQPYSKRGGY